MRTPNKSHSCLANFSLCTFITVIVVLSALVDTAPAQSAYYAGKTVRIIVGSTAGGGYDVNARECQANCPNNKWRSAGHVIGTAIRLGESRKERNDAEDHAN